MTRKTRSAMIAVLALAVLALPLAPIAGPQLIGIALAQAVEPAPQEGATAPQEAETLTPEQLAAALAPRTLGEADAPVTLAEYSSLSCGHCASFHAGAWPQIKAAYIDTGKVRLTYYDLPTSRPAREGAMLARCVPQGGYFAFMDDLFATQRDWAFTSDYRAALLAKGLKAGLTTDEIAACMASPGLRAGIAQGVEEGAARWGFKSTPSFVVGEQVTIRGARPFADFAKAIDAALAAE